MAESRHAILLFDLKTMEFVGLEGPPFTTYSLAFSSDGSRIAAGETRGDVHVWDVSTARKISKVELPPESTSPVALNADGSRLYYADHGDLR